jgi:hydrogenase nickel incorporation protein HypA/HybF
MHEMSLLADLMDKIKTLAHDHEAEEITEVTVRLGALSHISADHFREHFEHAARGTLAEEAKLTVVEDGDMNAPHAQDIMLESVDLR